MAKYLVKASNAVLSHCNCDAPLAAGPGQLDCPWCGCGWLISCIECRKAFTFATVVDVDLTYREIATRDLVNRGHDLADVEDDIPGAAEWLEAAMAPLPLGATVVYLDGGYFVVDETDIEFEGWFARHRLARLPHAKALQEPALLDAEMGDKSYWLERELPDRDMD